MAAYMAEARHLPKPPPSRCGPTRIEGEFVVAWWGAPLDGSSAPAIAGLPPRAMDRTPLQTTEIRKFTDSGICRTNFGDIPVLKVRLASGRRSAAAGVWNRSTSPLID